MTVEITYPPDSAGAPPHRHPSGPAFGYMLEGEMLFELEKLSRRRTSGLPKPLSA